jgi:hypothetical protein
MQDTGQAYREEIAGKSRCNPPLTHEQLGPITTHN